MVLKEMYCNEVTENCVGFTWTGRMIGADMHPLGNVTIHFFKITMTTIHQAMDILRKNNGLILQLTYDQSIMGMMNISRFDVGLYHRLFTIVSKKYGIGLVCLSIQEILLTRAA